MSSSRTRLVVFGVAMLLLGAALTAVFTRSTGDENSTPVGVAAAATSTVITAASATATSQTQPLATPAATTPALTVPDIYDATSPGVVRIDTTSGSGSGFLIDTEGHILTNYHVVAGARQVQILFPGGASIAGQVTGTDPGNDLALVTVEPPTDVEPLDLGDSDAVRVGESVLAIGNPFERNGTLTAGVVSGIERPITTIAGRTIPDAIQTDAPINPGNSGGPLLNLAGEVIGVNTQLENPFGQGNIGIGFAVPINTAKEVLADLVAGEEVGHPYLGISGTEVDASAKEQFDLGVDAGILVTTVVPGGPADEAGLESSQVGIAGDVIVKVDGTAITTFDDLTSAINAKQPGDTIELTLWRDGAETTLTVTLGEWPAT